MFAVKLIVIACIILFVIAVIRYFSKKPAKKNVVDGGAAAELEIARTKHASAKEHLEYATEKVAEEKSEAEERLEDAEDLTKEIDSSKSIIN